MSLTQRVGRVPIRCKTCGEVAAVLSEQRLQAAASLTPYRGRSSVAIAQLITDNAAVDCGACEHVAALTEQAKKRN